MKYISPQHFYLNRNEILTNYSVYKNIQWADNELFFRKNDIYFFYMEELEFQSKLRSTRLRSFTMNRHLAESTQFMKILKRHGKLLKYNLLMVDLSLLHRDFFENLNIYFNTFYKNYMGFHLYAQNNQEFFNLDYLLTYVSLILNPCIQLKVVRLPKFLQKKYKKKYDFKIKHVPQHLRRRYVYKRVVVYSGFVNYKKLLDRIYISLTETFLNPDENPLHKERFNFYKHTMKMYRFGKLNFQTL